MSEYQKQTDTDRFGNAVYTATWKKRKNQKSRSKGGSRPSKAARTGAAAMFPRLTGLTVKTNKRGG
jgi:hypothetical protein